MRTTTRRRNRLRSSQYSTAERWKPSLVFVVLAAGLLLGVALGLRGRFFNQTASLEEHYMLLVSDLYAQGVPLTTVRDRLLSLGYKNPSVAVLSVADQLANSNDTIKRQEADQLHQFAEALVADTGSSSASSVSIQPVPTSPPVTTPASLTPVAGSAAVSTPAAQTPTPSPSPEATANPAESVGSAPPPQSAAAQGSGVVQTSDRQPALVRRNPTQKSPAVAIVPFGTKVQILGIVQGEAIDPTEARWYHISYNGHVGYVYYKLIQAGG